MPIHLDAPLSLQNASADERQMLDALQGNILKGHGRHFTANLFFRFDAGYEAGFARALSALVESHVTSAAVQLEQTARFKAGGPGGGAFVHVALSAAGYAALGRTDAMPDDGGAFGKGMRDAAAIKEIHDPDPSAWEAPFRREIHGIVLAAHESEADTTALAQTLRALIEGEGGTIVHVQPGKAIFSKPRTDGGVEGIEHFGYVDGRSQPLLLVEDIDAEQAAAGTDKWNPAFPLSAALVKDPGTSDGFSFGSYFIFRKLEQNVLAFKTREQDLADDLDAGEDRELAGAFIVGRFEDGTPVTAHRQAADAKPPNNFNYDGDAGVRCPAHAHIRKTNPRGSGGAEPKAAEQRHIMPRRGIPYEDVARIVPPADLPEADTRDEFLEKVAPKLPSGGVGLLFMAYNRALAEQFVFTQKQWVNSAEFPFNPPGPHGVDPVIGQLRPGDNAGPQTLPKKWDDASAGRFDAPFHGFVTMKGGEYFFAPSLTFLRSLGASAAPMS